MIKKNKSTLILTSLVILIPILIGLVLWNKLPEEMPFHWNIKGEVDGWASKSMAVFFMPLFMLAMHWVCVAAASMDPKSANYQPKMFKLVLWLFPVMNLVLNTLVYASALGYDFSIEIILPLLMGAMFLFIGNQLPKMKQTYTMGIKLPWTLDNEENWNKTHRFAGKIWVGGSLIIMATAFIGSFWIMMGVLIIMVIVPTVYSYLLHLKQKKTEEE
jgi:uncharacterized membrane protein